MNEYEKYLNSAIAFILVAFTIILYVLGSMLVWSGGGTSFGSNYPLSRLWLLASVFFLFCLVEIFNRKSG